MVPTTVGLAPVRHSFSDGGSEATLHGWRPHLHKSASRLCFASIRGYSPYFESSSLTLCGNLSAVANTSLTCHICSSVRDPLKPGIPVNRIPFATFQ